MNTSTMQCSFQRAQLVQMLIVLDHGHHLVAIVALLLSARRRSLIIARRRLPVIIVEIPSCLRRRPVIFLLLFLHDCLGVCLGESFNNCRGRIGVHDLAEFLQLLRRCVDVFSLGSVFFGGWGGGGWWLGCQVRELADLVRCLLQRV